LSGDGGPGKGFGVVVVVEGHGAKGFAFSPVKPQKHSMYLKAAFWS
jgi:hypothetical protein